MKSGALDRILDMSTPFMTIVDALQERMFEKNPRKEHRFFCAGNSVAGSASPKFF